ncbi:2-oxoglutarate-Fe(II) type oxidoreductase hxnY [Colletotrichum orbiculare MAFF 240422]|uniref:2-oxoglutarate-Fe(II) type oxidoreductase hxnY n=1 Tax=Colletotrichum orbiculare (strain 104-T / ATCC 96160 / CBS 514.97 / LARS 414 / MAFF 240422) TaxID=1213857 RepID=N4VNB8_COLOR|nr:2-oxoglutarate-Fe(II) type oxidoreductase hxnY [Colletotrichum orbiculare MAFF 240422]
MSPLEIPIIDFSGFYSEDPAEKQKVVDQVRESCLYNGFFQIVGHSVPLRQQKAVMQNAKKFFNLPLGEKQKVGKENNSWNRGYEMLRSQILEEGTQPELKEGFYIGAEIPETHPYFIGKKLNSGPNQWPEGLGGDLQGFRTASMEYYASALGLASDLMGALALSLGLDEGYFAEFMDGAVATMRLLHYPSQPADADEKLTRGIGAHTDFGAITMLLQDEVDGLQVWDKKNEAWIDVPPTEGAFVVNLGNLMARWNNERYKSNIHRVINKSGRERYSIPVFVSGNPDYVVDCIPTCKSAANPAKFGPVTVEQAVSASYAESYGRAQLYKQGLEQATATKVQAQQVQTPQIAVA